MKLIVNADDFGRSRGINYGIIEAHLNGIVTSTTIMVNMPYAECGAKLLKLTPNLGVGAHITLDAGNPITGKINTLTDENGKFRNRKFLEQAKYEEIEAEVFAQIETAISLGISPTHLDSHHHVHFIYPNVAKAVNKAALYYNIPVRYAKEEKFIRNYIEHSYKMEFFPEYKEVKSTDVLILDFYDKKVSLEDLIDSVVSFSQFKSAELMCHPAFLCSDTAKSSYSLPRLEELDTLTDNSLKNKLKQLGIELISYRDI